VSIDVEKLYDMTNSEFEELKKFNQGKKGVIDQIVWTKSMKRLFKLVGRCLKHKVSCSIQASFVFSFVYQNDEQIYGQSKVKYITNYFFLGTCFISW
jgi:hypothetical protein